MRVLRDMRIDFEGVDYAVVTASEFDEDSISIRQGDDVIIIPKKSAAIFGEELLGWISTGGNLPLT